MLRAFVLGIVLDVAVAGARLPPVLGGGLINPDSYMRLVRLRAILHAQAPLHAVGRDGSGAGTVLAWSHLLDSLLLAMAWPLTLVLDQDAALRWAAVASGPLGVGALCAALAWAFAPLLDRDTDRAWRWTVAVPACLGLPIIGYGLPGVVHHHVLLAVCATMVAGFCARAAAPGPAHKPAGAAGCQAGAWAAAGLWLSPETMPFVVMAFLGLALAWTRPGGPGDPARGRAAGERPGEAAAAFGATLLVLLCLIVGVDPPAAGVWSAEIDRVSVTFVGLAGALLSAGLALRALDRVRPPVRFRAAWGLAATALPLAAWLACNPRVLRGPDALLTPEQARAMFGVIGEMQPVTTLTVAGLVTVPGALGAAAVALLAWRRRTWLWTYAAGCAVALVALGVAHARFSTYGAALGAGMLPVMMAAAMAPTREWTRAPRRAPRLLDRLAVIAVFVTGPPAIHLAGAVAASRPDPGPTCPVADAAALLAPFADAVVLAEPGDTPELLYRTGVQTVGSFYHRNPEAFMRLRAAWRSPAAAAEPEAVALTGAAAILGCAGGPRSRLVEDVRGDTLSDQLVRGEAPGWLHVVGRAGAATLYRVDGAGP